MTALVTVTIDRTNMSGSPADLVIDSTPDATYTLALGGLGRVGVAPRETLATASPFVHGQLRTAVVKDAAVLPLIVRVQAASSSALNTAVVALEDALWQFMYTVTVAIDGVSKVWTGYPATIGADGGLTTYDNVTQHYTDLSVSIPVYPVSA